MRNIIEEITLFIEVYHFVIIIQIFLVIVASACICGNDNTGKMRATDIIPHAKMDK